MVYKNLHRNSHQTITTKQQPTEKVDKILFFILKRTNLLQYSASLRVLYFG